MPDRIMNEFGDGMQAELEHDSSAVRFHRPCRWVSFRIIRWAGFVSGLEKARQHDVRNSGSQEKPAPGDCVHRLNEVCCKIGLQYDGTRSRIQDSAHHLV